MAKKKRVTGQRSHTKQRRPSPYKRSVLMILSVLCLLSGVLGVNAVKLHAKNTAYKQQEAELKAQISSVGKDLQSVKSALAGASDIREDLIAPIKAGIANGTYQVSGESFAQKLLQQYEETEI